MPLQAPHHSTHYQNTLLLSLQCGKKQRPYKWTYKTFAWCVQHAICTPEGGFSLQGCTHHFEKKKLTPPNPSVRVYCHNIPTPTPLEEYHNFPRPLKPPSVLV